MRIHVMWVWAPPEVEDELRPPRQEERRPTADELEMEVRRMLRDRRGYT